MNIYINRMENRKECNYKIYSIIKKRSKLKTKQSIIIVDFYIINNLFLNGYFVYNYKFTK